MRIVVCFVCMCVLFPYEVCGIQYAQCVPLYEGEKTSTLSSVTLPTIHIDTKNNTIGREERTPAIIHIEDAEGRLPLGLFTFTHQAGIKVRGSTATSFAKKSYAIEFCDSIGEEVEFSLFGMRNDGDWILDAMYIDHARMRNRLCTDIWNAYNRIPHLAEEPKALNGTRGIFMEVFLNGEYNGLYCFTERIDRKQLKLKKYKNS